MEGGGQMIINPFFHDIEQDHSDGSDWHEMRLGMFTASMISDLFMDKKTAGYQNCIINVAFERVTGKRQYQFHNKWMQYGNDTEFEAREFYQQFTLNAISNGGIWIASDWFCASPDGKIEGKNGGIELKCPAVNTYLAYIESLQKFGVTKVPTEYYLQMQAQMLATGWDFVDYMPYYSGELKQLLTRVYRDELVINQMLVRLDEAVKDAEIMIDKIKR